MTDKSLIRRILDSSHTFQKLRLADWFCKPSQWADESRFDAQDGERPVIDGMLESLREAVMAARSAYDEEVAFHIRVKGTSQPISAHDRLLNFGSLVLHVVSVERDGIQIFRSNRAAAMVEENGDDLKALIASKTIRRLNVTICRRLASIIHEVSEAKRQFAPNCHVLIAEMMHERDRAIASVCGTYDAAVVAMSGDPSTANSNGKPRFFSAPESILVSLLESEPQTKTKLAKSTNGGKVNGAFTDAIRTLVERRLIIPSGKKGRGSLGYTLSPSGRELGSSLK